MVRTAKRMGLIVIGFVLGWAGALAQAVYANKGGIKPIIVDSTIPAQEPTWRERVADWLVNKIEGVN